jgi:hypothetical protein
MDVWTAVWYFAFVRGSDAPLSNTTWFWLVGLFLTGFTLVVIGMLLGPIGQAARRAELPPKEVIPAEAAIQQTGAAVPQVIAPVPVAPSGYAPTVPGTPVAAAPTTVPYGS